jgi:hypothetical protein
MRLAWNIMPEASVFANEDTPVESCKVIPIEL